MVPFTAKTEVGLVAVKIVTAGLEGCQARQVAIGRGAAPTTIKAESTPTTSRLVPILLPEAMKL